MSQETRNAALKEKTQQLLEGPLKHIRGAALAAALLPLASIAAAPASAQEMCGSGGNVCGVVWNDTNQNGIQDAGEGGIEGAKVLLPVGSDTLEAYTGSDGSFFFTVPEGTYTLYVSLEATGALGGKQLSPTDQGGNDALDSDGAFDDSHLFSTAHVTAVVGPANHPTDFGFFTPALQPPGTGTPGYWKNHPEAWPVDSITVGDMTYTKEQAIYWLGKVGKDKTTTMFSSLVSATLNLLAGNPGACLIQGQTDIIASANAWMTAHHVGTGVAASSPAWAAGEPLHKWMDAYNNGQLCDPHRN